LVLGACAASYGVASLTIRPLRHILLKVGDIARGRFNDTIPIRRRDELGLLSSRINQMADSLRTYTDKLKETAEELRGTKEYLESFVGQTSDAIHVTDLTGKGDPGQSRFRENVRVDRGRSAGGASAAAHG